MLILSVEGEGGRGLCPVSGVVPSIVDGACSELDAVAVEDSCAKVFVSGRGLGEDICSKRPGVRLLCVLGPKVGEGGW